MPAPAALRSPGTFPLLLLLARRTLSSFASFCPFEVQPLPEKEPCLISPRVGALAVVCAAAAHAPRGTSASRASLAVCVTLPTKLPAALVDELRMLDLCGVRVTSGKGSGRFSAGMAAVVVERNSAEVCMGRRKWVAISTGCQCHFHVSRLTATVNIRISQQERSKCPSGRPPTTHAQIFEKAITPLCRPGVTYACLERASHSSYGLGPHGHKLGKSCVPCLCQPQTNTWPASANQRRRMLMSKPLTLPR
jgi:hypothetical protein